MLERVPKHLTRHSKFLFKDKKTELPKKTPTSPLRRFTESSSSSKEIVSDPGLRCHIDDFHVDIRDSTRREYVSRGPCQPVGHDFPRKSYGKDMRDFRGAWFEQFHWLEYSVSKNKAYCFYCYLFKPRKTNHYGSDVFVETGFDNWKRAIEKFTEHVGGVNSLHNEARILFEGFCNQRQGMPHQLVVMGTAVEKSYESV